MSAPAANSRITATIVGTAGLFAAAFWLLDSGSMLWRSDHGMLVALLPQGSDFVSRLAYACVFALAGAIAGAALQRSRDVEMHSLDRLRESERKYRALLASSFDSVITLDSRGRIVEMSESAAGLFNVAATNIVGQSIDDFVRPLQDNNDVLTTRGNDALISGAFGPGNAPGKEAGAATGNDSPRGISDVLAGSRRLPEAGVAVLATTLQGRRFPAEVRITRMAPGVESAFLLAVRETTSRVIAQKALRNSERRYQALFDNIIDGVYRSLPDGRLLAANPAMVRLLGYDSQDELLAHANTREYYADAQQRARLLTVLDRDGLARNFEFELRQRDGDVVTVLANIRAVTSDNNEDVVYEGTLSDISDLLATRAALQDSEEHFRALCEHSQDSIHVIDADGCIVYSSPSSRQLTGRTAEEQVGEGLCRVVHEDDVDVVRGLVQDMFARPGSANRFTCRIVARDGRLSHVEAVGTAFLTRDGQLRAVIQSRDVTERLETESQLRDMQKMQVVGRMTEGLAHDFNNLLTVISGNLELLDDSLPDASLRAHLDSALTACRQGSDLTRRLLVFADRPAGEPEPVNLNGLLLDLQSVLRRSLSDGIDLQIDCGENLWTVSLDAVRFEAAVLQLAVNARDAMQDEGLLTIRTRNVVANGRPDDPQAGGERVCVCISDNGGGMDGEVLQRATEPFFSTREGAGRTGLGLSVVKQFAGECGGELLISSEPGAGTTVRLMLPRADRVATARADDPAPRGSERVLVVDDNDEVRRATVGLLGSLGYDVREAAGGAEALALLATEEVELLFTDLSMPGLSGVELAEQAQARWPDTKIMLVSGNETMLNEASEGQDAPYELIRKPFRLRRLARQVRTLLDE